jgi:hypothetical protein
VVVARPASINSTRLASALSRLTATTGSARADDDVVEDRLWLSVLALRSIAHVL